MRMDRRVERRGGEEDVLLGQRSDGLARSRMRMRRKRGMVVLVLACSGMRSVGEDRL